MPNRNPPRKTGTTTTIRDQEGENAVPGSYAWVTMLYERLPV
jgi:hypothetical protein